MARVRGLHGDDLDGLLAEFEALIVRILRRIAVATANLLAGHPHVSVDDLAVIPKQWVEAVDGEVMPALGGVYQRAAAAVVDGLAAFGHDVAALRSPEGADFMAEARNRLVGIGDVVWEHARDELVEGMHAGEDITGLAARVANVSDVSEARATVIARSEVIAANNAASFAQALLVDDPGMTKSWEATPGIDGLGCDERTRPTHCVADGQSVPLREPFEVGGASLLFPGDPTGPVEEVAGCRCAPTYDFGDEPVTAAFDEGRIKRDGEGKFAEKAGIGGGNSLGIPDMPGLTNIVASGFVGGDRGVGYSLDMSGGDVSFVVSVGSREDVKKHVSPHQSAPGEDDDLAALGEEEAAKLRRRLTAAAKAADAGKPYGPSRIDGADVGDVQVAAEDGKVRFAVLPYGVEEPYSEPFDPNALTDVYDEDLDKNRLPTAAEIAEYLVEQKANYEAAVVEHDAALAARKERLTVTLSGDEAREFAAALDVPVPGGDTLTDGPTVASASGADFHLSGKHDQMSHAGGRAGHALSGVLKNLIPDDQPDDSLTLDGGRYFDWSTPGERGAHVWEVGDSGGDAVQMALQREDMQQLASALSITLLRDQVVPPNPDDRQSVLLASLLQAGQRSAVAFGDDSANVDDTGRYFDWSSRGEGGSFLVEVGANGEDVQLELTPDEMAQLHAQLVRTLLAGERPVDPVIPANEPTVAAAGPGMGEAMTEPLAVAADPPSGAMVALLPSEVDAARLAVDGGEPVEELHCTLMYLGDAVDIPAEVRQAIIDAVTAYVDGWPPVVADGFAVSLFNPPGMDSSDGKQRDTCVVLGLSGDDLDMVHDMVGEAVEGVVVEAGFTLPDQHAPWHAHTTLVYTDDAGAVAALADRVGPVTFDRVRVAFAGECVDIPLDAPHSDEVAAEPEPDGEPPPEDLAVAEFEGRMPAKLQAYWLRRLAPWGGPGSFTRCVRALRGHPGIKDPKGACANLYRTATGRWPGADHHSVGGCVECGTDLQTEEPAMADTPIAEPMPDECPDGQHVDPETGECVDDEPDAAEDLPVGDLAAQPGEHFHTWVEEGVSTGWRQFSLNAVTSRQPPFAYHEMVDSSAHGGQPRVVQRGRIVRELRVGPVVHWWGQLDLKDSAAVEHGRKIVEGWVIGTSVGPDESVRGKAIEYVWPESAGGEGGLVDLYADESEEMIFHAYRVAEITAVSVPALADAKIEPTRELVDALVELGVVTPVAEQSGSPIVAAGYTITIPDVPPAWWFERPTDVTPYGALTVTDEGRVYGRLAPSGIAHRSFPERRVTVPMGRVDYDRWMGGEAIVADGGRVVAGPITMECGHLPPTAASASDVRMQHYDNACSVVAKARVGEDAQGVWIAGALEPGVTADQVSRMLACRLSGDWAPHPERPGWREFVAALLVPVPGFPMARTAPSVRVVDDALVASAVPVRIAHAGDDVVVGPDLRPVLERVARSINRDAGSRLSVLRERVAARRGVDVDV